MTQPRIGTLSREECEQILARNHVGRMAYAWKNRVDIEPLHYVFDGHWLYGRTSQGPRSRLPASSGGPSPSRWTR